MTEPSSLLPLIHSSCKRLLLVGDPQQLPPTVETQHVGGAGARGLEQTLFDRMIKLGYPTVVLKLVFYPNEPCINLRMHASVIGIFITFLTFCTESKVKQCFSTQYRCPPEISSISSTLFYSGDLQDGNPPSSEDSLLPVPPLTFISIPGSESGYGESYSNSAEVSV